MDQPRATSAVVEKLGALPDWSAVPSDSEQDRILVNRRVAYFGGLFFCLSLSFYVYNAAIVWTISGAPPEFGRPALLLHGAATLVFGLQWWACRRTARTARELNVVDIGGVLAAMGLFAWMTLVEATDFQRAVALESARAEALLLSLITLALVVTHAIFVPGTTRRVFSISAALAAIAPPTAHVIAMRGESAAELAANPWRPLTTSLYVGMWSLVTVIVATVASRIIYGLQQRVRDAAEVGQYTLQEKIGEGGMGIVYRARHAFLRRPTAVKLLPRGRAGEHGVHRFEREVQLTSALTHPNTIAIYDFGHTPDGIFYYAMEYLDGLTLEELVAHAGPQPAARVAHILRQVASALSEAHGVGLIHRDIKPANVMLCVRGRIPDHVKVLDFGLVKEHAEGAAAGLSRAGALLGTPAYLAPEAILEPGSVDARTDLYALGAVGYQLLVGDLVFTARTIVELCSQHLHAEPVPPSLRTAEPVPPELERLLLACLAKRAEDRPRSADEVVRILDDLELSKAWTLHDARTWWEERAPALIAAAREARSSARSSEAPRTVAVDLERRAATHAA